MPLPATTLSQAAPYVSVVLPVKNGERYVEAAINSVLAQDHRDFELLIVDDASSDNTPAILDRIAAADPRIRILRDGSLGLVGALNLGLRQARAPLVARMDADDIALPQRLRLQLTALDGAPELALIGGQIRYVDADGNDLRRQARFPTEAGLVATRLQRGDCLIAHPTVMFRRDLVLALGGYRGAYKSAEDLDLWLRVSERGQVANLSDVVLNYRLHAGQVSQRQKLRQWFSTELAVRMAALRRAGLPDPTEAMVDPIDWRDEAVTGALGPDGAGLTKTYAVLEDILGGRIGEQGQQQIRDMADHLNAARHNNWGRSRLRHQALGRLLRICLAHRAPGLVVRLVRQMWSEDAFRTLAAPWRRKRTPGLDT